MPKPITLLDGLIAHWKMDEGYGVRYDSHDEHHDLIPEESAGPIAALLGKIWNAAAIDHLSQYLHTSSADPVILIPEAFTIAYWIRVKAKGIISVCTHEIYDNVEVFLNNAHGGADQYMLLDVTFSESPWQDMVWVNVEEFMNQWAFHVHTWQRGEHALTTINNGRPHVGTEVLGNAGLDMPEGFWAIGGYEHASSGNPMFDIDSFSIWDRALSLEEQAALYNNGVGLDYPFRIKGKKQRRNER